MELKDFEQIKGFEIITVKRAKTYHIVPIVTLLVLTISLILTFIYIIIPAKIVGLNIAFGFSIFVGIYNVIMELIYPEKHLHWYLKIPENYNGWKILYMVSKCIEYKAEERIVIIQFMDELESELEPILLDMIKEHKTQD